MRREKSRKIAPAPAGFFACKNLSFGAGNTAGKLAEKSVLIKRFHPAGVTFSAEREKPLEKQFANRRNKA
jgi:hypothetical protein